MMDVVLLEEPSIASEEVAFTFAVEPVFDFEENFKFFYEDDSVFHKIIPMYLD